MLLLQSGFPKSGNYWLYKILHNMLLESGVTLKSYARSHPIYEEARTWPNFEDQAGIDYLEISPGSLVFRKGAYIEPIEDLEAYLTRCSHVWTHSYWHSECSPVFAAFDRIVYIIRDPRDIAISASRYYFTPFMLQQHHAPAESPAAYLDSHLHEILLSWVQHVGGYLKNLEHMRMYPVFYERLLDDLPGELAKLCQFLDLDLDPTALDAIQARVTFKAMKNVSPDHVRRGQANQWRQGLSESQIELSQQIAGEMLKILGYSNAADTEARLPALPPGLHPQKVQAAIEASRGGLARQLSFALQFLTSERSMKDKLQKGLDFVLARGRWKSSG